MTNTIISTDTTDLITTDGNDTVIVTGDGSITETGTAIDVSGDDNFVAIYGDVISTAFFTSAISLTGGDSIVTVGRTGFVYSNAAGFGAINFGFATSHVINHGVIQGQIGVLVRGDGSSITNSGVILGTSLPGGTAYGSAILFMDTGVSLTNSGEIVSTDAGLQDYTGSDGGAITVVNSGEITGDVAVNFDFTIYGTLALNSMGTLTGSSGVAVHVERVLAMVNSGTVLGDIESFTNDDGVINSGDVQGDISLGDGSDFLRNTGLITGDVFGEAGTDAMKNSGEILGGVDMGIEDDTVINTGTIGGDVMLGDGDDRYLAKGSGSVDDDSAVYGGEGEDKIVGGTYGDTFYGDEDNDTIFGGGGNDMLFGGAGNDTLKGGADDDEIYGEEGSDTIYGGQGDDLIDGGLNGDTLFGGKGDDDIYGGNGSDELTGGKGDDTLTGGGGSDVFVLSRHDGNDVVTDFADGSDIVDLTVFGLGSKAAAQAAITEIDGGLLFDLSVYGGSGTVLIENMVLADFTGADFIY